MSKSIIPWRANGADDLVYLPFFKVIYAEKVHLKALVHGKSESTWNDIVAEVFRQDAFKNYDTTNGQALQRQFTKRLREFKVKYAYETGQANKSGLEGEFTELESILLDICDEIENAKAMKEAKQEEKEAIEKTETTTIVSMLSAAAKQNRASDSNNHNGKKQKTVDSLTGSNNSTDSGSTTGSYKDEFEQFNQDLNKSLQSFTNSLNSGSDKKLATSSVEAMVELKLTEYLAKNCINLAAFIDLARLSESTDLSQSEVLQQIGLDVLVNVYCSPDLGFNVKYVCEELTKYGVDALNARKIYMCLHKIVATFDK